MWVKTVVVLLLLAILISLGSGLVFLLRDSGDSTRTVKALTVRIALSLAAFGLLMLGYYAGWIHPNGPSP